MTKQSGLGDNFYIGGFDLSGDVSSVDQMSGPLAPIDVTGIKYSANQRIGGLRDADWQFTSFFNFAAGASHLALNTLPTTDVIATYFRGTATGNPAASINGKQIDYAPTRDNTGNLTLKTEVQANAYGMEWGQQLTPGIYAAANALTGANSTFEGGIGNWIGLTNNTATDSSAQHHGGADSLSMSSTASGDMVAESGAAASYATQAFAVVPGQQVQVQAWVRSAVSARTCSVGVHWLTSAGVSVSTTFGTGAADSTSAWTLVTGTVTAPATTAFGLISVKVASTGGASEVHYADDAQVFVLPLSYDTGASLSFGGQAYLQVTAFTGTDATISIYDSADNASFSAVSGLAFTQTTATGAQRIAIGNTATIRRYVAVNVVTTAGFTALSFGVQLTKNTVAGQVF
jgi:hypothetical protein